MGSNLHFLKPRYGGENRPARIEWDAFFQKYLPPESLSSSEYLQQLQANGYIFHQPLASQLYDPFYHADQTEGCSWISTANVSLSTLPNYILVTYY